MVDDSGSMPLWSLITLFVIGVIVIPISIIMSVYDWLLQRHDDE